jgi:hypothetical protein
MDQRIVFDMLCKSLTERGYPKYIYDESKDLRANLECADRHINPWGLYPGKEYVG